MKRLFDLVLSIISLAILAPVMLVVALFIKKDGGPILYKQVRVGLNGKEFKIFKFRSMVLNADKIGGYSTSQNDSRITSVGRVIRKTSIDELPQLFNVVLGDMSIVGPRPNVPAQRKEYSEEQWTMRNRVLPGITGLAQAVNRSAATWQERFDLDSEYVSRASFMFDLKIILMTVKQVFLKGGY
ncbi:MAG: sugar transferase [Oleiphilus sp.]